MKKLLLAIMCSVVYFSLASTAVAKDCGCKDKDRKSCSEGKCEKCDKKNCDHKEDKNK